MITIQTTKLINNYYGIHQTNIGTTTVTHSSIYGNSQYGVYNGTGKVLPATNNWWGSATGPNAPANPNGTGDKVSGNVSFSPWLTSDPN